MSLRLHIPANQAHIEELKDRLRSQLGLGSRRFDKDRGQEALIESLADVVCSMDRGLITTQEAIETFARHKISGFSFVRWLVDMVDEDVYLDTRFAEVDVRKAA